jgi:hypothetical protein
MHPEADLGIHPTSGEDPASEPPRPTATTLSRRSELEERGVEFTKASRDHGYGLVTFFKVPGGFEVQLYQPRYKK